MPSLSTAERVVPGPRDSWEGDDKLWCSHCGELRKSGAGGDSTEWLADDEDSVVGGELPDDGERVSDKAESGEALDHCGTLTALSQPAPCDLATPTLPDLGGDAAMEENCEVIKGNTETALHCVSEIRKRSTETSQGVASCPALEVSAAGVVEGAGAGVGVDEHDALDGGWGFMVVVGTFIVMTVASILGPGFGILFSDFLTERKTSSIVTSAIFNSESFAWSMSNMLAGPLTEQFGWRPVATAGGLLCFVGMAASAYAPSAPFLFFSYSILTGFGSGWACLASFAIIPHYFKRLLGRANGLTTAGMCAGGMLGPPLVTYLQEQFGFKGATLIVAAFALHICLAAALFRPVRRPSKVPESVEPRPGTCQLAGQMMCSLARNCLLLKSPRVMVIAFGGSFVVGTYLNLNLLVPFVMQEKGHTQEVAAWCMSISNLSNLAARLIVSSCSDLAWFSVLACYIATATLLCLTTIAFSFVQEVTWIIVVLSAWGFSVGSCMCLYPIIMVRYMGLKLYVPVLGVSGFINGVWMLCCGPAIGAIRDLSGSYSMSLCALGGSGSLSALLFLLMPAAVAYDKRKEERQKTKDAEEGG
ncbi:Monocarboxylate transporter 12 [Chionoecetes opilio]|uniref:Monocarboxylate transporter 12 n=1 Tax=Chionoecetes opilio TaxID=41210 RepID=A0A8J5CAB0_CHIOP|nr:Monocarboxylate transporter 12 [Chionoecetes opilio]